MPVTKTAIALFAALGAASMYSQSPDSIAIEKNHATFVMTNSAKRNEIISYSRTKGGILLEGESYDTGGRGSGGTTDPLGSQGSLTLSQDHSLLFAVNAGSGNVSVFRVTGTKLTLIQKVPSGGSAPVAVAQHEDLVYVINFAGNSNVVGFHLDEAGKLIEIPNSIRYLTATNSGPSSLAFSPDGKFLLVTEKLTNNIDVFPIDSDGTLAQPKVSHSEQPGLFDVVFSPGGTVLIVQTGSDTSAPVASISSYMLGADGALWPISSNIPTLGAAACWIALTPDGRYAYTANSGSATLSGFSLGSSGAIAAIPGTLAASLPAGSINIDIAVSDDGKYLYSVDTGAGNVGMFAVETNGTLNFLGVAPGVKAKAGFNGIAAF